MGSWKTTPGAFYPPWMAYNSRTINSPVLRLYTSTSSSAKPTLWALRDYYTDSTGTWCIAESPVPSIRIGTDLLTIQSMTYSREPWFAGDGCLFYSAARWAWIYRPTSSTPQEPVAAIGLDDSTWVGDAWYQCDDSSADFAQFPLTFAPAGTLLNASANASSLTATMEWPRWIRQDDNKSPEPCGLYVAAPGSGLSPSSRAIGLPVWIEDVARRPRSFRRSFAKKSSRYSYLGFAQGAGDIVWNRNRSAFVLGEVGASGWYETATAPTISGGATLVHMALDEADQPVADGADPIVLLFDHYEWGDEAESGYITEVVTWRP